MVPTVRWTRKGFAAEHPRHAQPVEGLSDGEGMEVEHSVGDDADFEAYDKEDSSANQRHADLRFRDQHDRQEV